MTLRGQSTSILNSIEGEVTFVSDAPLELIQASSKEIEGVINKSTKQFAFRVPISTFIGFNNPLQRNHFQENYMEVEHFTMATFTGRIVDEINFNVPGVYHVRGKGHFAIHGVEKEYIIKATLTVEDGRTIINSDFTVLLKDHNIRIPRIVNQKIAEEIAISVRMEMN